MGLRNPHAIIDKINAAQDRLIARKLRQSPKPLKIAKLNLKRWIAKHSSAVPTPFTEWHRLLTFLDANEVADFLCSDTPMARRLRQSSPFAGVLTEAEIRRIRQKHEKAGA
jgi:hypothetical protein